MRPSAAAILAIVLASIGTSCSKNQPAALDVVAATIDFESVNASAASATVYPSLLVDTSAPPDGVADITVSAIGRTPQPVCELGPAVADVESAWPYALDVLVVRAGTTTERVIDSTFGATGRFDFSRATQADTSGTPLPDRAINPPQPTIGGFATAYTGGVLTTERSEIYLHACRGIPPSAIPDYRPTTLSLGRGDLLKVSARRNTTGFGSAPAPTDFRATLLIDGQPVDVTGTKSAIDPESGFAFTYLLQ